MLEPGALINSPRSAVSDNLIADRLNGTSVLSATKI